MIRDKPLADTCLYGDNGDIYQSHTFVTGSDKIKKKLLTQCRLCIKMVFVLLIWVQWRFNNLLSPSLIYKKCTIKYKLIYFQQNKTRYLLQINTTKQFCKERRKNTLIYKKKQMLQSRINSLSC